VILGTVNVGGLLSLQHHPRVKKVVGTPRLSLVRPVRQAAASPKRKQTWGIERLNVPALWNQGLSGIGIKVGHLDTGVDGRHPALRGAIADFAVINNRGVPSPEAPRDSGYHGTHTAGTIAGRPVANRHIGVAPGAALASAAVIEGGDVVARILGGLDWVLEQGVRIVSLSLGFRGWVEDFLPIVDLLRDRDVLPIVAVGNEGAGTGRSPGNYPKVLSVGALDKDDTVPVFSSSQAFLHETSQARRIVPVLVAPGVDVISAVPNGRYQSMDGTSMATPHIAGLAALLMEAKPDGSAADIERAIYSSCSHPESALTDRANHGLPDGVRALAELGVTIRSGGSRQRRNSSPTRPNRKRR
jgi:subtilisin family serine protease